MFERLKLKWQIARIERARRTAKPSAGATEDGDLLAQEMIANCKYLGAKTARQAAEMVMGQPMTEDQWNSVRARWEKNWG